MTMMRLCPKCGDYYTDALLAFCLADGTPLVGVAPQSQNWSEGTRVVEEKWEALRKRKRKLKWRRIWRRAMTMLVATMVMCVVAVNSYIYLQSKPEPTPEAVSKETVSPTPATNPVAADKAIPPPKCSIADTALERQTIINQYGARWLRVIEGDRSKIIAQSTPGGIANANLPGGIATPEPKLGTIEYESSFPKACMASVTARYVWQVSKNLNGTISLVTIPKVKRFACVKNGETWHCR
jgi:hypothetical protein